MDVIELTKLFVEYKETADKLAELEKKIQDEVLSLKESQKIAGVKATYYQPSQKVDYEAAAKSEPLLKNVNMRQFTTITETIRWKEIVEYLHTDLDPFTTEISARVVVK